MERVLFLADRKELVKQAKNAFARYIPKTTMCNLLLNKEDRNAKFVFSTYPTILNAIDTMKNSDGSRFFSPGHFDLIVIDEAHRAFLTNTEQYLNILMHVCWGLQQHQRKQYISQHMSFLI